MSLVAVEVIPSANAAAVKNKFDLQESLKLILQPISAEFGAALIVLIKKGQAVHCPRELQIIGKGGCLDSSFPIAKCLPYIDENGLLRVGGHLTKGACAFGCTEPGYSHATVKGYEENRSSDSFRAWPCYTLEDFARVAA